jgi:hypothetical protein
MRSQYSSGHEHGAAINSGPTAIHIAERMSLTRCVPVLLRRAAADYPPSWRTGVEKGGERIFAVCQPKLDSPTWGWFVEKIMSEIVVYVIFSTQPLKYEALIL